MPHRPLSTLLNSYTPKLLINFNYMRFSEVIGQEDTKRHLLAMAASGKVPHAMLFQGPVGDGKMALAMAFASSLLCKNHAPGEEACGQCPQCAMLAKWEHPDLHFTFPTIKPKGSPSDYKPISDDFIREWHRLLQKGTYFTLNQWLEEIGVENQQSIITVRESDELQRKLSLMSSQGGYKINIMWLPEKMNAAAANKILKLLEEPPQQTLFILVSEQPELLLETIRSRTQPITLHRLSDHEVEEALVNQRGIDETSAKRIAHVVSGNWLQALDELDANNENRTFLDLFIQFMRIAYQRDVRAMKKWAETAAALGREQQKRMLNYFLRLIRENFMYNFQRPELNYMTIDEENFAKNFARFVNERNVLTISDIIQRAIRDISQNANARIVFYDMALGVTVVIKQ